jgi:hypothetical protein
MQNQNLKRCPSLPIGGLTQPIPLPYRNGVRRPIRISIGIITAPNIFTNPTSLHRFRLVGVIGFVDLSLSDFNAPLSECVAP